MTQKVFLLRWKWLTTFVVGLIAILLTIIPASAQEIVKDVSPPKVVNSSPKNGEFGIDPEKLAKLIVEFDEAVIDSKVILAAVGGSALQVKSEVEGNVLYVFLGGVKLAGETLYELVGTAKDASGNKSDFKIRFETMRIAPPIDAKADKVSNLINRWSPAIKISSTGSDPAIAIDDSGNIHVVWSDATITTGNSDIFYSRYEDTSWSNSINISNTTGVSFSPAIAIDNSRNVHVVWQDRTPGNFDIFYIRWDGSSWSKPINISNNAEHSIAPEIAIDALGKIHIVWWNETSSNSEIFYIRWDGINLTKPINISNNVGSSYFPAIAVDSSNNPHIVWKDETDILYSRGDSTGWSKPINIGKFLFPAIAVDSLNNPHVVGEGDAPTGISDVFYSRGDSTGWSKPINISNNIGRSNKPKIAVDALGNIHVAWWDETLGNQGILYSRWNRTSWSKPVNISDIIGGDSTAITMDSSGDLHVVWAGNTGLFYRRTFSSVPLPPAPTLSKPANGSMLGTIAASMLTLQWNGVLDTILYHVQIAMDKEFRDVVFQAFVKETKIEVPMGKLDNERRYFWRVRAKSKLTGISLGEWSSVWSFEVNATTNLVRIVVASEDTAEATVEVRSEKMKNLYGFQIDLFFDLKMLEVLEVKEGNFLKSIGGDTFWKPPSIDNQAGIILGILSSRLTPGEVGGEGILATIRFKVKSTGRSIVGFTRLKLSDEQANPITGLPIEGIVDASGLSATFIATPRIKNNYVVLEIQGEKIKNVTSFALEVDYPAALELIEGKTHIEGNRTPESGIVATLKFRIWESGEIHFHLKDGILKGPSGVVGTPTLLDGKITVIASPAWDVNKDYVVDIFDIVILGTNLNTKITGKPRPNPDVTGDGIVDLFDFVKVGANFGTTYSAKPGAQASPMMSEQHSITFNKELAQKHLPLWQKLYTELEKYPTTSSEFNKTKILLQELMALVSGQTKPTQTKLMQNYPNPFNPETWIPYQLANAADVNIRIYDVAGRMVRILNLGRKDAGFYMTKDRAAYWDGRNDLGQTAASGIYFYTIQAGDFVATQKMIIIE